MNEQQNATAYDLAFAAAKQAAEGFIAEGKIPDSELPPGGVDEYVSQYLAGADARPGGPLTADQLGSLRVQTIAMREMTGCRPATQAEIEILQEVGFYDETPEHGH